MAFGFNYGPKRSKVQRGENIPLFVLPGLWTRAAKRRTNNVGTAHGGFPKRLQAPSGADFGRRRVS